MPTFPREGYTRKKDGVRVRPTTVHTQDGPAGPTPSGAALDRLRAQADSEAVEGHSTEPDGGGEDLQGTPSPSRGTAPDQLGSSGAPEPVSAQTTSDRRVPRRVSTLLNEIAVEAMGGSSSPITGTDAPAGSYEPAASYQGYITVVEHLPRSRDRRRGEIAVEMLGAAHPRLAARVRGTDLDPASDDDRLPAFHAYLRDNWSEGTQAPVTSPDTYKPVASPEDFSDAMEHYDGLRTRGTRGQLASHLLENVRPDLASRVNGTDLDPYGDDDRLPAFHAYLRENWSTGPLAPAPTSADGLDDGSNQEDSSDVPGPARVAGMDPFHKKMQHFLLKPVTPIDDYMAMMDRFDSLPPSPSRIKGQTAFVLLEDAHPRLAAQVQGTDLDPSRDDDRLPAFFEYLGQNWER